MKPEALIILSLVSILAASWFVYWVLVRRITTERGWIELCEWAAANRYTIRRGESAKLPAALSDALTGARPIASLTDARTAIARMEAGEAQTVSRRNVLVRETAVEWPRTALRPAKQESSLVDALQLPAFASLTAGVRFVIHGIEPGAAFVLARSRLLALAPPDVGVILDGRSLILDFSARPFDPLELQRVTSLAEQLVAHLPSPKL